MSDLDNAPRFTGIFIPVEILEIEELTPLERILLSWIDALYNRSRGGCFATNKHLAEKMRVKENTIVKSLIKFRRLGLIEDVSFDGRQRVMRAKIADYVAKCQSQSGCEKNHTGGVKKITGSQLEKSSSHYRYEIKEERKGTNASTPEASRLALFLFEKVKEKNPKTAIPKLEKWAVEIDRLLKKTKSRPDPYTAKEVQELIEWAFEEGNFWGTTIASASGLKRNIDKMQIQKTSKPRSKQQIEEEKARDTRTQIERNKELAVKWMKGVKNLFDSQNYAKWFDSPVRGIQFFKNGKMAEILGFGENPNVFKTNLDHFERWLKSCQS